jgi:hypothetical protein
MNLPIWVINLDESKDRYVRMGDRLGKLGLAFWRVPAVSDSDRRRGPPLRPI